MLYHWCQKSWKQLTVKQRDDKMSDKEQIQPETTQTVNIQTTTEQKNRKKRKLIVAGIGLAAVIAAGIIYNRMQPKEVTNYDTAFEEEQTKPEGEGQKASTEKGIKKASGNCMESIWV